MAKDLGLLWVLICVALLIVCICHIAYIVFVFFESRCRHLKFKCLTYFEQWFHLLSANFRLTFTEYLYDMYIFSESHSSTVWLRFFWFMDKRLTWRWVCSLHLFWVLFKRNKPIRNIIDPQEQPAMFSQVTSLLTKI